MESSRFLRIERELTSCKRNMVDLISWLNSQSYFHLAPFFTRFSRERTARFENDAQGSCYISPQKESTRGRTLTELSAVNTGHAARGFTTPENMDAQSPFHSFQSVDDKTSRLLFQLFPFFLPFLLSLFSLFFYESTRREKRACRAKGIRRFFFFFGNKRGNIGGA